MVECHVRSDDSQLRRASQAQPTASGPRNIACRCEALGRVVPVDAPSARGARPCSTPSVSRSSWLTAWRRWSVLSPRLSVAPLWGFGVWPPPPQRRGAGGALLRRVVAQHPASGARLFYFGATEALHPSASVSAFAPSSRSRSGWRGTPRTYQDNGARPSSTCLGLGPPVGR